MDSRIIENIRVIIQKLLRIIDVSFFMSCAQNSAIFVLITDSRIPMVDN